MKPCVCLFHLEGSRQESTVFVLCLTIFFVKKGFVLCVCQCFHCLFPSSAQFKSPLPESGTGCGRPKNRPGARVSSLCNLRACLSKHVHPSFRDVREGGAESPSHIVIMLWPMPSWCTAGGPPQGGSSWWSEFEQAYC